MDAGHLKRNLFYRPIFNIKKKLGFFFFSHTLVVYLYETNSSRNIFSTLLDTIYALPDPSPLHAAPLILIL